MPDVRRIHQRVAGFVVLVAGLGFSLGACSDAQPAVAPVIGPVATFHDGTTKPWASFEGEHLLINYWAEWCKPCRKEIPELNELDHRADIAVVGVNFDGIEGAELLALMERLGIEFPVAVKDPREVWGVAPIEVLPTTIVVDDTGKAMRVLIGPQTAETLLQAIGGG